MHGETGHTCKLLEVDALGTAALQCLVKDLGKDRKDRAQVSACAQSRINILTSFTMHAALNQLRGAASVA